MQNVEVCHHKIKLPIVFGAFRSPQMNTQATIKIGH